MLGFAGTAAVALVAAFAAAVVLPAAFAAVAALCFAPKVG